MSGWMSDPVFFGAAVCRAAKRREGWSYVRSVECGHVFTVAAQDLVIAEREGRVTDGLLERVELARVAAVESWLEWLEFRMQYREALRSV